MTDWFTQHEAGARSISILQICSFELSAWLVWRNGKDIAEGLAATVEEAREQAETAAQ
jgi:hypothetical protein